MAMTAPRAGHRTRRALLVGAVLVALAAMHGLATGHAPLLPSGAAAEIPLAFAAHAAHGAPVAGHPDALAAPVPHGLTAVHPTSGTHAAPALGRATSYVGLPSDAVHGMFGSCLAVLVAAVLLVLLLGSRGGRQASGSHRGAGNPDAAARAAPARAPALFQLCVLRT